MKLIIKITIIGPESTGKTTLTQQLAHHYQTSWVREYARSYIENLNRPYEESDLVEMAKGQIEAERQAAKKARKYLFCDTDLRVI